MFDWDEEWNISFAGCGFRSVYYLGALSCFLQNVPRLVHGASRICGASSGCLVAAALTVGIPIEQFCADVLAVAREARRHTLGVFHPSFSLLRTVRASLLEKLPADAHLKASGRLCVSLTRLTDGRNVLVSEFNSREELIQVLMCSCFFPVYCGFTPPSYRGVYYMDGALSNNMPLFERRNTITVAPFSGESDVCPRDGSFNFVEVHYGNVSIHVNSGNVHRIWTSFLPPSMEDLAEICHSGYVDALQFLRERDLLGTQRSEELRLNGLNSDEEEDLCLGLKVENLPAGIKKVLCEAFRDSRGGDSRGSQLTEFLPVKMVLYLLSLLMLPFEMAFSLSKSLISSLLTSTGDLFRNTWSSGGEDMNSAFPERYAFNSDLRSRTGENNTNFSSTKTTNSNKTLHWNTNGKLEVFPLPSPCSGPTSFPSFTPAYSKVSLNHRR
ncbi:Patatin-like phospholipase domain containing protein 2 [Dissostichus eleginoides]|uniref:triacylglycerol lipase n=1 Tax=Dissostichus eleginoides TaxID=100907 RepID=A0AAD9BT55_DISEL|nr:Patatin-like phospholipase domain containing protein 2 [Dissostichus eleginoides]